MVGQSQVKNHLKTGINFFEKKDKKKSCCKVKGGMLKKSRDLKNFWGELGNGRRRSKSQIKASVLQETGRGSEAGKNSYGVYFRGWNWI